MAADDRIHVLAYDDGSPGGALVVERAVSVASRVLLVMAVGSPNHTHNVSVADAAGVPVDVVVLPNGADVHDALCACADDAIHLAFVPRVEVHRDRYVRRIVQAAG
ncbi:MAG: hypothetical protein KDB37_20305, partial [Ilumatobacter sp.]|nr:hypothetical protein [Ilumatobacter sp.]